MKSALALPLCMSREKCGRPATRGLFSPCLCALHGADTQLAPGVTEDDERAAMKFDEQLRQLAKQ